MKKFVKLVLPVVLILAVVLSFGACSSGKPKKSENAIEGKWFLGEDFDEAGFRFPDELEFLRTAVCRARQAASIRSAVTGYKFIIPHRIRTLTLLKLKTTC